MLETSLQDGQSLLFIGDSITDCGRRERDVPLGVGYVRLVADMLAIREPHKQVRVLNRGIGGNTCEDLHSRWQDHVLAHRPDHLVIKIGINDLNRYLTHPEGNPAQSPERFGEALEAILGRTRAALGAVPVLIVSPFYASHGGGPDTYRGRVLERIPEYIRAGANAAETHRCTFLDLHAKVQHLLRRMRPDRFAEDAVHPTPAGALFIAEAVYAALSGEL